MDKVCHVLHASRLTTYGTIFLEIFFGVSKEWVKSWSHVFLISNLNIFPKKLLVVRPEKGTRREKKNKTRMAIAKLIALNAKAKMFKIENISVCKTSCKCHFHLNIVGYGIKIAD